MLAPYSWYLVRTKSKRENYVRDQLSRILPEAFLPMVKPVPLRNSSVVPLFPQYIFARFDLSAHYFEVRYMPGVTGIVSAGPEPLAVSEEIVNSVRARCTDGVAQLSLGSLQLGEHVRVVKGPFRNFDAVFEGYLSGAKRVAILIQTVTGPGLRVNVDASIVTR